MQSIPVRISKEQYQVLRETAKRRGMLISALLNKILAQYFKEKNNEN